jgi:hypothetical protein
MLAIVLSQALFTLAHLPNRLGQGIAGITVGRGDQEADAEKVLDHRCRAGQMMVRRAGPPPGPSSPRP